MEKQLFHYCTNQKAFAILAGRSIRMSDIQKSNDYKELSLFFPEIFDIMEDLYLENPFYFKYDNKEGKKAFYDFIDESYRYWKKKFSSGEFSNFVLCLSESCDCLSQWRGYSDNGKGCCIGFSKNKIREYCDKSNGVLRLEKVTYLIEAEIYKVIEEEARDILSSLKDLRKWIVDEMTHDDNDADTDGLLGFNFNGILGDVFTNSLKYKSFAFNEEKEWRLFLSNQAYKNPEWICNNRDSMLLGPNGFAETVNFLRNKIEFHTTDDDLIPFYPIKFNDFSYNPVVSVWLGPKNKTRFVDLELFLMQYGYKDTIVKSSRITYD